MSISGTRGIVRVSKNLACGLQAAMAVEHEREPDFYRRVTGEEYPGEYGERFSARRRGTKFEAYLHENDAAGHGHSVLASLELVNQGGDFQVFQAHSPENTPGATD